MANIDFRVKNGLTVDGTSISLGTSTTALTTATVGGAITGNILKVASTASGTANISTDVTTGIFNLVTSVTTGTVNIATGGASTTNIGGAASTVAIGTSGNSTLTVSGAATIKSPATTGTDAAGNNLTITSGNGTGTGGSGNILFQTAPAGSTGSSANTMATVMTITTAGNVGIGTVSPVNNANYGGLTINGTTGSIGSWLTNGTENFRIQAASTYTIINNITSIPLLFYTNNTERVRIKEDGNVVIGSGSDSATPVGNTLRGPNAAGTNITGGDLTITAGNGTGTGGSGNIYFQTAPVGSSGASADTMVTRLTISPAGLVKISAPTLATTFVTVSTTGTVGSITGSGPWAGTITAMAANSTSGLFIGQYITATAGGGSLGSGGTYMITGIPTANNLNFIATGGTAPTAGTITNILTNPTTNLLELYNSNGNANYLRILQIRNTASPADWTTATTRIQSVTDVTEQGYIDFNPSSGNYGLAFGTGSGSHGEKMRIDASGNVGIGTTNPSAPGGTINLVTSSNNITVVKSQTTSTTTGYARFDLATGTANSYSLMALQDNTASPYFQLSSGSGVLNHYYDGPTHIFRTIAGTVRMTIDASGNVGIGKTNPSYKLDVSGSIRSYGIASSVLANPGTITAVGSSTGGTIPAGTYYFKVVAVDGTGRTTAASPETTGVTTTGSTSKIDLSWTAVVGAIGYQIWFTNTSGTYGVNYDSVATNTYSFISSNFIIGGTLSTTNTTGAILPTTNNAQDLGSSSLKWANVYATNISGSFTGNADTATKLATARNINGVAFDGTADISITTATSLTVAGNLIVNGTTTTINSSTMTVDDKNLELGVVVSATVSTTGTVGTIIGTGPWTATITGMTSTAGLIIGSTIAATSGVGTLYGGTPTSCVVASIVSSTSITYTVTGGTIPTAGTITNITTTGATDDTANGGGITLKGTTDKTLNWVSSTSAWTSSEHINLANGKKYYLNGSDIFEKTLYIGTTGIALNRAGSNQPLNGITSIDGGNSVSQSLTLQSTTGNGTSDSIVFKVGNNGATTAMTITTSGAVGIGSIADDYSRIWKLVVRKDQNATTQIGVINANTGASAVSQIVKVTGTNNSFLDWGLCDNAGSPYDLFGYGAGVTYTSWSYNGIERMRLTSGGNLIVGSGEAGASPVGNTLRAPSGAGTNIAGANLTITAGNGTGTGGSGNIYFQTAPTGSTGASANTMATVMSINSSGHLIPGTNNTYNLGSDSLRWSGVYATNFYRAGTRLPTFTASASTAPATPVVGDFWYKSGTDTLYQYITDGTTNAWLSLNTYPNTYSNFNVTTALTVSGTVSSNLTPTTTNSYTLGTSGAVWSNVYATTFTGNLTGNVTGNVTGSASSATTSTTQALSDNSTNIATTNWINKALYSVRAAANMTGGGTISYGVTTGYVKWTNRFIVIGDSKGTSTPNNVNFFDIYMPTTGLIDVVGTTSVSATANGIPLSAWQALYYDLSAGTNIGATAYHIMDYALSTANYMIPATWVLLCVINGDYNPTVAKFSVGITLAAGQTYIMGTNSSVRAQYADLAENYASDCEVKSGDVVVFGGDAEITKSSISHDDRIAGIVSTNPAYLMNANLEDGVAVALQGRVPCKVLGPVTKGQNVVASSIPGVAQALDRTQYSPGCVIGKSLEDITTDEIKTIEVVVGRL